MGSKLSGFPINVSRKPGEKKLVNRYDHFGVVKVASNLFVKWSDLVDAGRNDPFTRSVQSLRNSDWLYKYMCIIIFYFLFVQVSPIQADK